GSSASAGRPRAPGRPVPQARRAGPLPPTRRAPSRPPRRRTRRPAASGAQRRCGSACWSRPPRASQAAVSTSPGGGATWRPRTRPRRVW
ncbi:unnamed protein product, partial [Prorocentrum cordatum]